MESVDSETYWNASPVPLEQGLRHRPATAQKVAVCLSETYWNASPVPIEHGLSRGANFLYFLLRDPLRDLLERQPGSTRTRIKTVSEGVVDTVESLSETHWSAGTFPQEQGCGILGGCSICPCTPPTQRPTGTPARSLQNKDVGYIHIANPSSTSGDAVLVPFSTFLVIPRGPSTEN